VKISTVTNLPPLPLQLPILHMYASGGNCQFNPSDRIDTGRTCKLAGAAASREVGREKGGGGA